MSSNPNSNRNKSTAEGPLPEAPRLLLQPANPGQDFLNVTEWASVAGSLRLTKREVLVARLLLEGHSRQGVAGELDISVETVRVYINGLFKKLEVADRLGLALRFARIREVLASRRPCGERSSEEDSTFRENNAAGHRKV